MTNINVFRSDEYKAKWINGSAIWGSKIARPQDPRARYIGSNERHPLFDNDAYYHAIGSSLSKILSILFTLRLSTNGLSPRERPYTNPRSACKVSRAQKKKTVFIFYFLQV